jgi:hypothetical protein
MVNVVAVVPAAGLEPARRVSAATDFKSVFEYYASCFLLVNSG